MMADQTINPVLPVNHTRDVLKKKKDEDKQKHQRQRNKSDENKTEKKGIIDTYA